MVDVNWIAIVIAAVVFNAIGFAWYSDSLFGKKWRKESGMSEADFKKGSTNMNRMFILMTVSSLIMAYVLAVVINVFEATTIAAGLTGAFWLWLGFVATTSLNSVIYEKKSWMYFGINVSFQLVGMLTMGVILALWV